MSSENMVSKLKNRVTILLFIGVFGYLFYKIGRRQLTDYLLKSGTQRVRAVIIDEKNSMGNNTRAYSYSYLFYVNEKAYKGDAKNPKLQVGDSIDVEYAKDRPEYNKALR